jgi:uncharacterized membrane protein
MMMGEYGCLLAYAWGVWQQGDKKVESPESRKAREEGKEPNRLLFAIPAVFDVLGSTCNFFGLSRVAASVYQMMRAFMIVITATLSVIFLKRKYYIHHMIGICLVIGGVIIVGTVSIHNAKNVTTDAMGIIFLLIAQCFSGCMFITEEKLIKSSGHITPLLAIGLEGLSGCTLVLLLLPILNQIPSEAKWRMEGDRKVYIFTPFGYLEDSPSAVAQIFGEPQLALLVFGSMVSIGLFNWFGINVTKILSSSSRAVIDPTRTLFIWIMSILLGWEEFITLQLVGFVISTTGMLIFNEFLPIPCLGIDYNHNRKIQERNKRRGELIAGNQLRAILPSTSNPS